MSAGCSLFSESSASRGRPEHTRSEPPSHIDITLASQCERPVVLCWDGDHCAHVSRGHERKLTVATNGMDGVFVALEKTTEGVFLDVTFSRAELDQSCVKLVRALNPQ